MCCKGVQTPTFSLAYEFSASGRLTFWPNSLQMFCVSNADLHIWSLLNVNVDLCLGRWKTTAMEQASPLGSRLGRLTQQVRSSPVSRSLWCSNIPEEYLKPAKVDNYSSLITDYSSFGGRSSEITRRLSQIRRSKEKGTAPGRVFNPNPRDLSTMYCFQNKLDHPQVIGSNSHIIWELFSIFTCAEKQNVPSK